jgi:hypothetical protein
MLVLMFTGSYRGSAPPTTITIDCVWSEVRTGVTYSVTVSKAGSATTLNFLEETGLIRYVNFMVRTLPGYRIEVCGKMFPERTYVFRSNIEMITEAVRIWIETRFTSSA